jgi:DNA-binding CsgD family transcriptional regulator/tetratricopeptide (TPR) repeat protein
MGGVTLTRMALLEREHVLAALRDYTTEARAGEGRMVVVAGEAGIGKSALIERLLVTLDDGIGSARAECDGLFTPRALGPLFDLAEQLDGDLLDACRRNAPRDELFTLLLQRLKSDPVVVVVDDVHWADESTLDLLRFLGRRIRLTPSTLLVTYRDDAVAPNDPLRLVLGELATERGYRRIDLSPLSIEAVEQLVAGTTLDAPAVLELTGGNPFFVTEVVQSGSVAVPASARDAALARIARLSSNGRSAVEYAALAGAAVDPVLLADAGDVSSRALDELIDAGVLVSTGPGLHFRHELTRRAVQQEIAAHRRTSIHEQLLHALQKNGCQDDARLAYHADGANDAEAVQRFAPRAAELAAALGSHREAAAQYERALRFAGDLDLRTRAELYDRLGHETSLIDQWERSAEVLERSLELWEQLDDPLRAGDAMRRMSRALWRLCRGIEGAQYVQKSVETLEPLGPSPELARAYIDLAVFDDRTRLIELSEKAIELAERYGLTDVQSDAYNSIACQLFDQGGDWEPMMRRALDLAVERNVDDKAGRAFANLQVLLISDRRFAEADQLFRDGFQYCEEHDIATYGLCLRGGQADLLVQLGRWDEALEHCDYLITRRASPVNVVAPLITKGSVLMRRDRIDEGVRLTDEAAAVCEQLDEPEYTIDIAINRAELHWLGGDLDAAREQLAVAVGLASHTNVWKVASLAVWAQRLDAPGPGLAAEDAPEPFRLWLSGDFAGAAAAWDRLGASYDAAMALLDAGTEDALLDALTRLEALGATATARVARRALRDLGVRSIPNGARSTTRAHPAGLTRREHEILDRLCQGKTNSQISDELVISLRTVDHHVSAVLGKLGVSSRVEAAEEAARRGLVDAAK